MLYKTVFSRSCLCVPGFQDTVELLIYNFLQIDEKWCTLQESKFQKIKKS
jgi:hypothetical protein